MIAETVRGPSLFDDVPQLREAAERAGALQARQLPGIGGWQWMPPLRNGS